MESGKILYQVKSLEKMIVRVLLKEHDVMPPTQTQMQIMGYIISNPKKEIYQKDLENILNLRRATVSGVLQTMEKSNLIERVMDDTDTRTKKIKLSKKANDIFLKHKDEMEKLEENITSNISKEDLETFNSVINTMKKNLKEIYK
mgnify:FL=1